MAFKMTGMDHGYGTGSALKNVSKTKYGEESAAFQMNGGSGKYGLGARQQAAIDKREKEADIRRAEKAKKREERKKLRKSQRGERKDLRASQKIERKDLKSKQKTTVNQPKEKVTKTTGTKKYSDLPADQRDAAKAYNMRKYGTHNPTARAKSLGITKAELAKRHSADEAATFAAKKRKNRDTKFM